MEVTKTNTILRYYCNKKCKHQVSKFEKYKLCTEINDTII